MRRLPLIFLLIITGSTIISCLQGDNKVAKFEYFRYQGNDAYFDREMDPTTEFFNPVIAGFYPDPSIVKWKGHYYLVHSSFSLYPGVPLFKSNDLVNWKQIGHVLDRPSQLNLDGLHISSGIFAPAIQHNPFNDKLYMVTTCTWGIGNFYVTTSNPDEGWSEPVILPQVNGIDPSIFFDDDGKAYILECAEPFGGANYSGERSIVMHKFDWENDVIVGEPVELIRGGVKPEEKPIWIEASHIYKVDGYYYLMCAEGGTGLNHSEVIFRSQSVWGPYEPWEKNPILTQRDLPEERNDKVTTAGHADLVQTDCGEWWAVFHGCRPYDFDMVNTGRETFLLPVEWVNGWPLILPQGEQIPVVIGKGDLQPSDDIPPTTGNFTFVDQFRSNQLDFTWKMIRTPRHDFYSIGKGYLGLTPLPITIEEMKSPAVLLRSQQHTTFEAETKLVFAPAKEGDFAGFTLFQNEKHHFVFGKTIVDGSVMLVVNRLEDDKKTLATLTLSKRESRRPIYLKVAADGRNYDFLFSTDGKSWVMLVEGADGGNLSSRRAGGFIGALVGLYATSTFVM